jgi:signal transduction histidine kinase
MRALPDEVVVEVIDRGCGMSPQFVHNELFKPFASTKEGGFGVGAFEARTLITAMGGRIEVHSREQEGSIFRIFLPIARDIINLSIDNEVQAA